LTSVNTLVGRTGFREQLFEAEFSRKLLRLAVHTKHSTPKGRNGYRGRLLPGDDCSKSAPRLCISAPLSTRSSGITESTIRAKANLTELPDSLGLPLCSERPSPDRIAAMGPAGDEAEMDVDPSCADLQQAAGHQTIAKGNHYFDIPQLVSSVYTGREALLEEVKALLVTNPDATCRQLQRRLVLCGLGGSGNFAASLHRITEKGENKVPSGNRTQWSAETALASGVYFGSMPAAKNEQNRPWPALPL